MPRQLVDDYFALMDDSAVAILPHALRIVAELGVADALAAGPTRVDDLASSVRAHADSLYRLLRALTCVGLFAEPAPGTFELTDLGHKLRSDSSTSLRESLLGVDSHRAWLRAAHSVRSGAPVFRAVHGAEFFEHKDVDAAGNRAFLRRMRERAGRLYAQVVQVVDWGRSGTVMDLGGGDGFLLDQVLQAGPRLSGVLFDRPNVIEVARQDGLLARHGTRCRLAGGDFFDTVPVGADTHLLCSVLHDWPDDQAVTILRNSRKALDAGGRALIVEMLVPTRDEWHPSKWSDIGMMVLTGGRERTEAEFADLLAQAGYTARAGRHIPGSYFSLIEAD